MPDLAPDDLVCLRESESMLESGQGAKALARFRQLPATCAGHPEVRRLLGYIELWRRENVQALRTFLDLSRQTPDVPSVWFGLAVAYARVSEPIHAELALRECMGAADRTKEWDEWEAKINRHFDTEFSEVWRFTLLQGG